MSKTIAELNNAKFNKWLEDKRIHTIDINKIVLTEKIHTNTRPIIFKEKYLNKYSEQESITRTIVIKPCQDGYSLISGYRWYTLAKALNKPVNAVIVGEYMTRDKFIERIGLVEDNIAIPEDAEYLYPIHKVKIPRHFQNSNPSILKIAQYGEYFVQNGCVDKAITVKQDKNNRSKVVLQDGWIRFLILRGQGIKHIPVKFVA